MLQHDTQLLIIQVIIGIIGLLLVGFGLYKNFRKDNKKKLSNFIEKAMPISLVAGVLCVIFAVIIPFIFTHSKIEGTVEKVESAKAENNKYLSFMIDSEDTPIVVKKDQRQRVDIGDKVNLDCEYMHPEDSKIQDRNFYYCSILEYHKGE